MALLNSVFTKVLYPFSKSTIFSRRKRVAVVKIFNDECPKVVQ
jgi:hypothetical protein